MGRPKATSFKFSVEFSERDNTVLEKLAETHGVTKREILRQGLMLLHEIAKAKQTGARLLITDGNVQRELLLMFAL